MPGNLVAVRKVLKSHEMVVAHKCRKLILVVVAFHPSIQEVERLRECLGQSEASIGYAVVVNDYIPGEPVEALRDGADLFLVQSENMGYGRAVNLAMASLSARWAKCHDSMPSWIGALNTDLYWEKGTFETLLQWLSLRQNVVLAVPAIHDPSGSRIQLCKRDPTLLALISRRFIPHRLKPPALRRYDDWYVMSDMNYEEAFDVPYLSGCCMIIRSRAFCETGGFNERFFLYLEDADLTRRLRRLGRCLHVPIVHVVHIWGRGSHRRWGLTVVNLISALRYFRIWGLRLW